MLVIAPPVLKEQVLAVDVFLPTLLAMAPARANQIKPIPMDNALPWRYVKVVFTTRETTFAQLDPQNAPKLL